MASFSTISFINSQNSNSFIIVYNVLIIFSLVN
ncbi:hypothetical protein CoNPh11_CDS0006 [Staphylococcus phage S-CoN_Ph11]|nr:hypothetical protein CoNPh11_CDS0006 [Staphylococcus phage S-CoN_Ph11]